MRSICDFFVLVAICAGGVLRPSSAATAFVPSSPPAAPRCYRKNRHNKRHRPQPSNRIGRQLPIAFIQWQSSQRYRQAASALRSTVSLAETLSRNSTHDDAAATSAPSSTAFVFTNTTAAAVEKLIDIEGKVASGRMRSGLESGTSRRDEINGDENYNSDFVEPDDRHAEGVDALANYFAPMMSSDISSHSFGGGGNSDDNIKSNEYGPSDDDQDDDDHRRAHALAPPGYGKTLLALQTMAELRARGESINTALYVVPTIRLVDQALQACDEYGIFRDVPHNRMIVASKSSRKEKRTTKAEVIAEFLESSRAHNESSFLVCTYKSLHRVGEALRIIQQRRGLDSPPSIDFATFDEAHKTEGCAETTAYGLYDDNIFTNRRLFVTGTAKNYTNTPQRRQILGSKLNDKDGSRSLVTKRSSPEIEESDRIKARSFRNRDLYGPCLFRRTNQECVENKITVPVKLCCLSKREMFSELGQELNISSYTRDEIVPFATMAAYSKFNATRGVSFHSLVARSEEFVELAKPLFEESGFYISHVNGKMRAAEQERRLAKSRSVAKSHMANCQLWREGVDVPEWDLVVVADAVSDHVIAQQIIGRVSRRHPGKECGYVFIPDLFDEENGFEAGSEGYDAFVSIFQAMMADDPQLQRDVLFVSGNNAENRTLNVTEYPTRLRERFQLPASVPLPIQQEFIRSVVVELGGGNSKDSVWMGWFNLLKTYKEREGDCLVRREHVEEGKGLGKWINRQRNALRNGSMTSGRKEMLDEIGFCWDVKESAWQEYYALLKKYKEREGDCFVPDRHAEEGKALGKWVSKQREALQNGRMTSRRKELLDDIGFCWDAFESAWQEYYALLKKYKRREGDCLVPFEHVEDGKGLGNWVSMQRKALQKGSMTSRRKELLDDIGFCWDVLEYEWECNFKLLEQYAKREGHCDVPFKHEEDGKPLGWWLNRQRQRQKKGTLETSQQERLEKLGVIWNLKERRNNMNWMNKYKLLVKFKEREGHCKVPTKQVEEGENLGRWLAAQKDAYRKGKFDQKRYQKLKELGVEWLKH